MRLSVVLVLESALTAFALPAVWLPDAAKFYSTVSREISKLREDGAPSQPDCDLSNVPLPETEEPLPQIPEGQHLLAVTVGRGTQNYTCETSDESTKPEATGAVATLFDASCVASNYPDLLNLLPNIALQLPKPEGDPSSFGATDIKVAGQHYFSNGTTAVFDMSDLGLASVMKDDSVDAPASAVQGQESQLTGAVPWLYLTSIPQSTGETKTIYRVNTAGGKAPENCLDQPEELTIEYASQYWFYG